MAPKNSVYYREQAERALKLAYESDPQFADYNNAQAQVYATLALAEAVKEAGA